MVSISKQGYTHALYPKVLRILKDAGIRCTGVTSPRVFEMSVESEYVALIVDAMKRVGYEGVGKKHCKSLPRWQVPPARVELCP